MAAGVFDFEMDQGASWSLVVVYLQPGTQNPDGSYNLDGAPVNITGWTAALQIKESPGATAVLANAACVIDGPAGKITATLTRQQTATLPNKTPLCYDLLVVQGTTGIRLIEGRITLDKAVSTIA